MDYIGGIKQFNPFIDKSVDDNSIGAESIIKKN